MERIYLRDKYLKLTYLDTHRAVIRDVNLRHEMRLYSTTASRVLTRNLRLNGADEVALFQAKDGVFFIVYAYSYITSSWILHPYHSVVETYHGEVVTVQQAQDHVWKYHNDQFAEIFGELEVVS